jgi:hypothetical protein
MPVHHDPAMRGDVSYHAPMPPTSDAGAVTPAAARIGAADNEFLGLS